MGPKRFLPALFLAAAAGFLATLTLTGVLPLPPDWGASTTQARTIVLEGGRFGPVAEPPAIPAVGGSNPLVSFQGRLTTPGTGLPVPNGSYSMTFRIFDAPAGGNSVWTETQGAVSVSGGLFNVQLGSVTALYSSVFDGPSRHLEVQVSPDPAMIPRFQFGYVPYAFQAEQAGALNRLGFSTAAVDSPGNVGQWISVTLGADGLPVISYYDVTNGDLKVAHCGNASCSAGNIITTVDSPGDVGQYTSVTVGTDGLPVISYLDFTNFDLKVAHCGNSACSTACGAGGTTCTAVDTASNVGFYTSVTVGTDGLPLISYHDNSADDLKVAHCGNAACTTACGVGGTTCTAVDTPGNVADWTSVTVGADGLPVISYHDLTNGDLKVAHCGTASCSTACGVGGTTCTAVDSAGTMGTVTSVTIGTDGLPVVSYLDFSNFDLRVAHCGNSACSTACGVGGTTCTTVDSTGLTGEYTSVTVGADGLPVVSYYANAGTELKVAHCGNLSCSAGNTVTAVDSAGVVGPYSSLTMGADGQLVVSYWDETNGDLRVAHCSNRFCTPFHRPR